MKTKFAIFILLTLKCLTQLQAATTLTKNVKQAILDNHNYYRSQVALGKVVGQYSGSNIVLLDWDDDAGTRIATWTDQCQYGHDVSTNRKFSNATNVGQNMAFDTSATGDVPSRVTGWYNEVNAYTYSATTVPTADGPMVGHYTQLVWANTAVVGCAKTDCTGRSQWALTFGCNYEEAGNFLNQFPYLRGSACTACPENYPKCHKGLCATNAQCAKLPAGSCTTSTNKGKWLKRVISNTNVDGVISRVGDPPTQTVG